MKLRILSILLLLSAICTQTKAQTRIITGKVISFDDKLPLPGVAVKVTGTNINTQTGTDGNYSINIPVDARSLTFSYIGFSTEVVVIGNQQTINISLENDEKQLSEVVVVGYGNQIRRDITGSISKLTSKDVENTPVQSFESAIQGKAAGVVIESGSGKVGQGIKIRVRGTSSIGANSQPLYVLDGVPINSDAIDVVSANEPLNPLADINPNDIASIEVLKDASSSAIYGSRGSNGVILITTKKGANGKTNFNVSYSNGFSNPTKIRDFLNTQQYVELYTEAQRNRAAIRFGQGLYASRGFTNVQQAINFEQANLEGLFDEVSSGTDWRTNEISTNWAKESFRNDALSNQLDFSAQGGNDKTRFYASGGFSNQDAIVIVNKFKRYTGLLNIDHKATDKIDLGLKFSLAKTQTDRVSDDNEFSTPGQLVALQPLQPTRDPSTGNINNNGIYFNGLIQAYGGSFQQFLNYRNLGNTYFQYKILPELKLRSEFGIDLTNQTEETYYTRDTEDGAPNGAGSYGSANRFIYNTNNYINYNKTFNKIHNVDFTGGISFENRNSAFSSVSGINFPVDQLKKIASAGEINGGTSTSDDYSLFSYFIRSNYKFKDRYLVSLNGRADASSRFGKNNRYGIFPAASLGWIISDEDFLKNSKTISLLKFRVSYGVTGNDNIPNYSALALFGTTTYPGLPGLIPDQIANPDLKWESTKQFDVGIDFGIFNNRLSGEIDFYQKNTSDILLNVNQPATSGFTTVLQNIGKLSNKGVEIGLNSNNLVSEFKWSTNFNISFNKNKVTNLGGQVITSTFRATQKATEGQPIGVFFMPRYAGVDPANGDALYFREDGSKTNNYNLAFRQVVGDPNPEFTGGFTNTFSYKRFDLSAFVQFVYGNEIYNGAGIYQSSNARYFDNQTTDQLNRWQTVGQITDVPQARRGISNGDRESSRWIYDGSYARLKNLTLGYSIPGELIKTKAFSSLRLFVTGYNLATLTNYKFGDPEVNTATSSNIAGGVDFYSVPQARTIIFGANFKF